MRWLTIWLAAIAACAGPATAQGATRARSIAVPKHRVGFLVFDKWSYLPDDGSAKPSPAGETKPKPTDGKKSETEAQTPEIPLVTAVWYPASKTRKRPYHKYCEGVTGLAITGALLLPGDKNRPLIVFSHDFGGSAFSAVYLMEYLAGCGYIVAAVDHNDPVSSLRITGPGQTDPKTVLRHRSSIVRRGVKLKRETYAYRRAEIAAVIDKMIAESKNPDSHLAGMVDPDRIGIIAHGLGGFTTMCMMGMPLEPPPEEKDKPAAPAEPPVEPAEPKGPPEHLDKRIKAAVLYSPPVSMWAPVEYFDLTGPIMVMYGEKEEDLRKDLPAPASYAYDTVLGPKWSVEFRRAHGMTFCNTATIRAAGMPSQVKTVYAVHRMIGQYATVMFDLHVRGRMSAASELTAAQAKKDTTWVKTFKAEPKRLPRPAVPPEPYGTKPDAKPAPKPKPSRR